MEVHVSGEQGTFLVEPQICLRQCPYSILFSPGQMKKNLIEIELTYNTV